MNYKEIQSLKKSELRDLLATTLQQKATLERANWSILVESKELKDDYIELKHEATEKDEESDIFRTQNIILHKRLECLLDNIDMLETANKIHLREKQEAREQRDALKDQINELVQPLAEGSTPKNAYLHEVETIFVDSGELHLVSENLNLVINCSNFVQDLATINDLVIKEAKKDLADSIQQIKQYTNDL